jgi:hypothetical protein
MKNGAVRVPTEPAGSKRKKLGRQGDFFGANRQLGMSFLPMKWQKFQSWEGDDMGNVTGSNASSK